MLHTECVLGGGDEGGAGQASKQMRGSRVYRTAATGAVLYVRVQCADGRGAGRTRGPDPPARLPAYPLERAACLTLDFDSVRLKGGTAHPESLDNAERGTTHAEPSSGLRSSTPRPPPRSGIADPRPRDASTLRAAARVIRLARSTHRRPARRERGSRTRRRALVRSWKEAAKQAARAGLDRATEVQQVR